MSPVVFTTFVRTCPNFSGNWYWQFTHTRISFSPATMAPINAEQPEHLDGASLRGHREGKLHTRHREGSRLRHWIGGCREADGERISQSSSSPQGLTSDLLDVCVPRACGSSHCRIICKLNCRSRSRVGHDMISHGIDVVTTLLTVMQRCPMSCLICMKDHSVRAT